MVTVTRPRLQPEENDKRASQGTWTYSNSPNHMRNKSEFGTAWLFYSHRHRKGNKQICSSLGGFWQVKSFNEMRYQGQARQVEQCAEGRMERRIFFLGRLESTFATRWVRREAGLSFPLPSFQRYTAQPPSCWRIVVPFAVPFAVPPAWLFRPTNLD